MPASPATKPAYTTEVLATTCPHCSSEAGQPCWRATGPDSNFTTTLARPHKARVTAAATAPTAPGQPTTDPARAPLTSDPKPAKKKAPAKAKPAKAKKALPPVDDAAIAERVAALHKAAEAGETETAVAAALAAKGLGMKWKDLDVETYAHKGLNAKVWAAYKAAKEAK